MTSDGTRTYAWDAENRLIRIVEGPKRTEIEYDGFHHWTRIVERNGSTTVSDRRFIWNGNTLVEQRNGTSTTAAQRCFPQGVQQGTSKFFYTRDHLGSIREVVNNSGAVVARYDYDPYGRRTKLSGTFDSDFGFTGHYVHAPSGLHFAPFRAYSAELGRWQSRDPIGEEGGINLYGYVAGNPVNLWDPLGLLPPGKGPPTSRPRRKGSKDDCPSGNLDDVLGKIWNAPKTVIGLAFGGLGLIAGADVSLGNNAIQFENHPLMSGAITLGNTISYERGFGPSVIGDHERQHTYQGQQLGPLYLPSNAAGLAAGQLLNGHTHGPANWNERGPQSTPPRPW